ncbi:hypothetical protein KX928_23585 [Roseobacter sp. YSTF-M11]|uniref:Uncharacterized protein n=1 Tax=Roseobacter insulae TaxID=2859783 RepID=A0A9X1FZW7_9RHOB|nr:hypothetical protein [Roseobacter insulae]MBW4710784.1 hypothetical protein [Roseobacter insulae]
MAVLKLPTGSDVGIALDGRPPLFLSNTGVTEPEIPVAVAEAATSLRSTVLDIPVPLDSPVVRTQPAVGRAHVRSDGRLVVDLRDTTTVQGDLVSVEVEGTVGGAQMTETLTVPVNQGLQLKGWAAGDHYRLPTDSNNAVLVEIGKQHRKLYVSTSGFTKSQIEAREGISNANQVWLLNNPAVDGNGAQYGETPELAVDENRAQQIWGGITGGRRSSCWLLFKRGETFTQFAGSTGSARGEGPLHPLYIGAYGTGPDPIVATSMMAAQFLVVQDIHFGSKQSFTNRSFMMVDGCFSQSTTNFQGLQFPVRYCTLRRHRGWDISYHPAPVSGQWPVKSTREQSCYLSNHENVLIEDVFFDVSGWAEGYDYNAAFDAPQPPTQYSHVVYASGDGENMSVVGGMFSRGALTGIQGRTGPFVRDAVFMGNNLSILLGGGPDSEDGPPTSTIIPGAQLGNFSFMGDSLITWAGQKTQVRTNFETARGINLAGDSAGLRNNVIIGAGPGNDGTRAHGVATTGESIVISGFGAITGPDDTLIHDWLNAPDADTAGLSAATLSDTTLNGYAQSWLSNGTADRYDLIDALRASPTPVIETLKMRDWFFTRLGREKPAAPARTHIFRPPADSSTPGIRWDCRWDWDAEVLPGQVPGDSVDLDGHYITNSWSTAYPLVNLSLSGGRLTQFGDRLDISGDILTGGGILVAGAGQIFVQNCSVMDQTSIELVSGRFGVTGTLSGAFDMTVRGIAQALLGLDTASSTIADGQTLTVKGSDCQVGFDGSAGGAATLTCAPAATLRFETAASLSFTGLNASVAEFTPGTTVQGDISGFTARIVWIESTGNTTGGFLHLDTITGIPVEGENLIAEGVSGRSAVASGIIAQVNSLADFHIGQIATFRSGMYGQAAPNVTSTVILDGALEVDVTGLDVGDYHLIVADTLSGGFATTTITGGTATVAAPQNGRVTLTVS